MDFYRSQEVPHWLPFDGHVQVVVDFFPGQIAFNLSGEKFDEQRVVASCPSSELGPLSDEELANLLPVHAKVYCRIEMPVQEVNLMVSAFVEHFTRDPSRFCLTLVLASREPHLDEILKLNLH